MKKLCIGGPLDGQYVESDQYLFPYTEKLSDLPDCDSSRELETVHYKTLSAVDRTGIIDVLVPETWSGSILFELINAYHESRKA